jgi:HAMP domain-containing protein
MKKGIPKKGAASGVRPARGVSTRSSRQSSPALTMAEVMEDIATERARVRRLIKAGKFRDSLDSTALSGSDKLAIVTEELGEVAKEVVEMREDRDYSLTRRRKLRTELTQLAGTAIAWLRTPGAWV